MLVGNKLDLAADRVISRAQAEELATKWGAAYFETSALRDTNVSPAFMALPTRLCQGDPANDAAASGRTRPSSRCTIA